MVGSVSGLGVCYELNYRVVRQPAYVLDCFFLVRLTVSRLRTWRRVCEDSRIFMYAASVSAIVLSYSFREAI